MMQLDEKYETGKWYGRQSLPYPKDRKRTEQYADWLKQVPWQLFCTFTFAWKVSDDQANKTFLEFISRLEHHLRCDVGYLREHERLREA